MFLFSRLLPNAAQVKPADNIILPETRVSPMKIGSWYYTFFNGPLKIGTVIPAYNHLGSTDFGIEGSDNHFSYSNVSNWI